MILVLLLIALIIAAFRLFGRVFAVLVALALLLILLHALLNGHRKMDLKGSAFDGVQGQGPWPFFYFSNDTLLKSGGSGVVSRCFRQSFTSRPQMLSGSVGPTSEPVKCTASA